MFSDPLSITIGGTAMSFPRIGPGSGPMSSVYRTADGEFQLEISHNSADKGRRESALIRLSQRTTAANPLNPTTYLPYEARGHFVINCPANGVGITDAQVADLTKALCTFVSTPANLAKIQGQES